MTLFVGGFGWFGWLFCLCVCFSGCWGLIVLGWMVLMGEFGGLGIVGWRGITSLGFGLGFTWVLFGVVFRVFCVFLCGWPVRGDARGGFLRVSVVLDGAFVVVGLVSLLWPFLVGLV